MNALVATRERCVRPSKDVAPKPHCTRHNHSKPISVDLNLLPLTVVSLTKRHLCAALLLYNLHSLTDGRLRRLVQPVLSPVVPSAIFPKLDCFQALGIKRYTLN
jgi:hypothetical protein